MHDSKRLPSACEGSAGVAADGRTQVLRAGAWHVQLELEALGAGELVGVGLMSMPEAEAGAGNSAEVLIGGTIEHDGTARLRMVPIEGQPEHRIVLRVRSIQHPDTSEPIVSEVLGVEAS